MDASEDSDVPLQKAQLRLPDEYAEKLRAVLDDGSAHPPQTAVWAVAGLLVPFQEAPQLLDPSLPHFVRPLTDEFVRLIHSPVPADAPSTPPRGTFTRPAALSYLLYTLCKIRGYKVISRFLPNEPRHLEPVSALFSSPATGVGESWQLRYILLLWLGHLLLAPFDLSTISSTGGPATEYPLLTAAGLGALPLPSLCRRLVELGMTYLARPGNRESDAAALLLIRISLRRDMRALGLLDAVVSWGSAVLAEDVEDAHSSLFLKTGVLTVLAGILAQGAGEEVAAFVPRIFALVRRIQDDEREEWKSGSIRKLAMKIYRWVALLSLAHPELMGDDESILEDIIERLLNSLGDRETAVRLGASKSLAVVSRKLSPELAGDVIEAVMGVYDEDIFLDPPFPVAGRPQKRVLYAVAPEKWHGATLTLATFLRQRAVRSTEALTRVVNCIVETLSFEQRRATFAMGGNVRDAACYAAWSIARSYTTDELHAAGEIVVGSTFTSGRRIPQIIATELVTAACLDPLGNVRRAASAALQELVGRHPNTVHEGISLVQAVDYSAVALRRRAVVDVAHDAAALGKEYWRGIVFGIIEEWRGVGASDEDGRRLAARSLGKLLAVTYEDDDAEKDRIDRAYNVAFRAVVDRIRLEGVRDVEIYHGTLWALAEVLDAIEPNSNTFRFPAADVITLHSSIFAKLKGSQFVNPVLRPELTAEATSRIVSSLAALVPEKLPAAPQPLRLWTAILEASLDRIDDTVLAQATKAADALFRILTPANRAVLLDSWCTRVSAPTYRHRGHVLALGEVSPHIAADAADAASFARITATVISAATRPGEVELRVAGIRALAHPRLIALPDPAVLATVLAALDDYTTDTRGDIGSLVRAEAVTAILAAHTAGALGPAAAAAAVPALVRLAAEKLDRLRPRAFAVLQALAETDADLVPMVGEVPPVTSRAYFGALLPLLCVPRLREPLLAGLVTAAGGGSDSLRRAARGALAAWLDAQDQGPVVDGCAEAVVLVAARHAASDRVAVPALETAAGLLELGLLALAPAQAKRLFNAAAAAHYRSGSVPRLAAAVRVYRALGVDGACPATARLVREKLLKMLLHPFPRVRVDVAEALWLVCLGQPAVEEALEDVEWMRGTKELGGAVRRVGKALGVL